MDVNGQMYSLMCEFVPTSLLCFALGTPLQVLSCTIHPNRGMVSSLLSKTFNIILKTCCTTDEAQAEGLLLYASFFVCVSGLIHQQPHSSSIISTKTDPIHKAGYVGHNQISRT